MPYKDLELFMGPEQAHLYADPESLTGLNLPSLTTGQFTVSGISAMMQDWEQLRNLREVILPLFENPEFVPYLRAFPTIKAIETRLNLKDEGIRVDDQTGLAIEQWQRARMGLNAQAEDTVQQAQAAQAEAAAMAGVAPA